MDIEFTGLLSFYCISYGIKISEWISEINPSRIRAMSGSIYLRDETCEKCKLCEKRNTKYNNLCENNNIGIKVIGGFYENHLETLNTKLYCVNYNN